MLLRAISLRTLALHIPDGFLSLPIALMAWLISALLILIAIRRTGHQYGERQIPLMGVMAAFIFAGQLINFPVGGGTSGHLLGGALAAILLGPWGGMLVMTAVIVVQALLFQDGGLVVMGANILNMGLITSVIGYGLYRSSARSGKLIRLSVAGAAAWLSVMAGALATALQLWLSGTSPLRLVVPAMLSVHALIGVGEALITGAALGFLNRIRPDLVTADDKHDWEWGWVLAGIALSLMVVFLAPFASTDPDGLARVAGDLGFLRLGSDAPLQLLPNYSIPALGETALSTALAGLIGVLFVAVSVTGLIYFFHRPINTEKLDQNQSYKSPQK